MAGEVGKAQISILEELVAMQMPVIVAHATIQCPTVANGLRGSGIKAKVEESAVGDEELLALIDRLLVHAADTC